MNKQFDEWWEKITAKSNQWTTLERLAALQAWEYQQEKIDELETSIEFRDLGVS